MVRALSMLAGGDLPAPLFFSYSPFTSILNKKMSVESLKPADGGTWFVHHFSLLSLPWALFLRGGRSYAHEIDGRHEIDLADVSQSYSEPSENYWISVCSHCFICWRVVTVNRCFHVSNKDTKASAVGKTKRLQAVHTAVSFRRHSHYCLMMR